MRLKTKLLPKLAAKLSGAPSTKLFLNSTKLFFETQYKNNKLQNHPTKLFLNFTKLAVKFSVPPLGGLNTKLAAKAGL